MKINEELLVDLAQSYVNGYKRELKIYNALCPFDLYIEDEGNKYANGIENFFNSLNPEIIECLLEYADEDKVTFYFDNDETLELNSVAAILGYILEEKDNA